jgi:flagellar biosynthesis protein FlhF
MLETMRGYHQEIYLVVSATTKYRDLVKITQTYSDITNYRLLFTKIDETSALGNILNIKMLTNAPLSYTTFGQNVPDDIVVTDAQFIAKQLLGGNE